MDFNALLGTFFKDEYLFCNPVFSTESKAGDFPNLGTDGYDNTITLAFAIGH